MKKQQHTLTGILCLVILTAALIACNTTGNDVMTGHDVTVYDREGNPIVFPDEINSIISIGPSNTEILVALGFGDRIVQTDSYSTGIPGIQTGISTYDMLALDLEHIISLAPDVIFTTGLTQIEGDEDPLGRVKDVGISVIDIPTAESIADIKDDIHFIATVMGAESKGNKLIEEMDTEINRIQEIASGISEKKRVYFELSPAPWMWTFGTGTFLQEMLEIAGAINIFADIEGWTDVTDEVLLETKS